MRKAFKFLGYAFLVLAVLSGLEKTTDNGQGGALAFMALWFLWWRRSKRLAKETSLLKDEIGRLSARANATEADAVNREAR